MTLRMQDLLGRGYFPKELPPPFTTIDLAANYPTIKNIWNNPNVILTKNTDEETDAFNKRKGTYDKETKKANKNSKCGIFSITKGLLSRRNLSIPNPIHFVKLSETIVNNWDEIESKLLVNTISMSTPIYQKSLIDRCFRTKSEFFIDFVTKTLDISYNHTVELKLDISMFYHRIYTHAIPWALLGRDKAKEIHNNRDKFKNSLIPQEKEDYKLFAIGNTIDEEVRASQEDQTIGIPVGQDTSLIIAELILSQVDEFIENESDISACRYFDDYCIYTNSFERADEVLKKIEQILFEYNLEINESKVSIREFPFHFIDDFTIELRNFNLGNNFEYSIKQYFSIVWKFASIIKHKKNQIFRYSFAVFDNNIFDNKYFKDEKNWKTFEDLMFKSILICPSAIDVLYRIVLRRQTNGGRLTDRTLNRLKTTTFSIIDAHTETNESFEVSWGLWICKVFSFKLTKMQASKILLMRDSITRLILLDILNTKFQDLKKELNLELRVLSQELVKDGLLGSNWLLLYEATSKNWLNINPNKLKRNHYFNILHNKDISFYDSTTSLTIQSVEYVFNRRRLQEILKVEAKDEANRIFDKIVKNEAKKLFENDIQEYFWDPFFNASDEDKELRMAEIETELKAESNYTDLREHLYNEILDKKASDIDIDEAKLYLLYLDKLNRYAMYK